jgi:hypothetical protein
MANINYGCRSIQMLKTINFKNFSSFIELKIDSFINNKEFQHNYYMFKCVEIQNYNLFFGLSPFTNKKVNPSEYFIKKLISFDCINWIDCGNYKDYKMFKDNKHLNCHVGEILFYNNLLNIILFTNCMNKDSYFESKVYNLPDNLTKNQLIEFFKNL